MKDRFQTFNSEQAAKILGVNVSTIKRWTDEGKLGCIRSAGGHRKFLMSHLADFLRAHQNRIVRVNLFPLEDEVDLQISPHILKGDFDFLVAYVYEQALLCRRRRVQKVLNGLYLGQYPLHEIYDRLVTPVLHKIGDSQARDETGIVEEHLAAQTLRDGIIRLQGMITIPPKKIGTVLCLNLLSELHDIALKMVDHILEARGFLVLFSGQVTPVLDIERVFKNFQPDRVYISGTTIPEAALFQGAFHRLCDICQAHGAAVYIGGRGFDLIDYAHPAVVQRLHSFAEVHHT